MVQYLIKCRVGNVFLLPTINSYQPCRVDNMLPTINSYQPCRVGNGFLLPAPLILFESQIFIHVF